ncbi:MAG: tetratricopeptide repeat protein [Deltaproteobacteria bacterium]|nr:tetratricopeptide repeat protein [Deltaproteobacteria bacterium]
MASKWRCLIWVVPLGFVALIMVLVWRQDRDFWRTAPALMQLAQDAARRGDYSGALKLASKARAREPENFQYCLEIGQIYLAAGQPQQALRLCRQLGPQDAKSTQGLKLQARALDLLGDRQAGLDLLAEGLKENPDDPEILALAATLSARENYDRPQAITYYQHLYHLTRDPLVRHQLLELLISLNRFQEAIPLQEEEVVQFPTNSEALHQLALLHYWQRDYQAAGALYQRLLRKSADDAALRLEAARNAEAAHQTDQALAHYLWLYSRSRGEKEYALALARLWARKGNHAEAAGVLAPLMQENPDCELRRQYALELLLIGDLTGALKTYQAAWNAGDTHQETIINLARLQARKGHFDQAAAMWDEAGRRQLLKGELRWESALTYSYARRFDDALKSIQPLRHANSRDPKLLLFAGQMHFYQKNWGQAARLFSAYLEQNPKDVEIRRQLAEALSFTPKNKDEALKEYGEILKVKDDIGLRLRRISLLLEGRHWDEAARELHECPIAEDPKLLQEQARLLVWLGDLPGALNRYELLLQKTQDGAARLGKAQVLIYLGRAPEALELLNRLRQEPSFARDAVVAAIEAYLTLKDYAKALRLAAKELEPLSDMSVDERALVARCYFHSPDPKHLRHTCDLLLSNLWKNRYHHPTLLILTALLPRLPHYGDLDYLMDRIPGTQGSGHGPAAAMAYFDSQLGRHDGKLSYLLHVLQGYRRHKQPNSPGELLGLAWLATELGDRQAAAAYYRRAQKLRPSDPQIAQLLLQCQLSRKDWVHALGNLENQKDNPAAPLEMARIYQIRGQYEGVKAMDARIPPGSKERISYLRLLVQACRSGHSYPEALQALAQLEGKVPQADFLMEKAQILEDQGDQKALEIYDRIIKAQPGSQMARIAQARRNRAGNNWGAAYRAYEAALKEAPQDIELLNELEFVRQQMRPELASRGFPYSRGERHPEEASRPLQFSRFGREPTGLGLSNYLPALVSDVLPVVQPESLYFQDSNKLYGWLVRAEGSFWVTKVLPARLGMEYREYNQDRNWVEQGQLDMGLNPVYVQQTNAASRLRRLDASLGLGPLSVDDRLRLSGDLILRRYWKRTDLTISQQGQLQYSVMTSPGRPGFGGGGTGFNNASIFFNPISPLPPQWQTITENRTGVLGITEKESRNRLLGSLEVGFNLGAQTDMALRYSRRDIFDQEPYAYPRLYQSVLNLPEARITTYQQADLAYNHQFQPGLDWRGTVAGAFYSDHNRRLTLYQGLAWQAVRQPRMHLALTPHYYLAAYRQQHEAYFSPHAYHAFGLGLDFDRQIHRLPTLILQGTVQGVSQHGNFGPALQGLAALEWEFVANFYTDLHYFYFREFVDNYRLMTAGVSFRWKF